MIKLTIVKVREGYYQDRDSYEAYYSNDTVWVQSPLYRVVGPRGKIYKECKTEYEADEFIRRMYDQRSIDGRVHGRARSRDYGG